MFSRRTVMTGVMAAPLALSAGRAFAQAAATPPSLDELLRKPGIIDAALSPSGKHVAVLGQAPTEDGWYATSIVLLDADRLSEPGKRLDLGDSMDAEAIAWGNDDRLLIWLKREFRMSRSGPGGRVEEGLTVRRLLAIGADGSRPVGLFSNDKKKDFKGATDLGMIVDSMPADPEHVLMLAPDYDNYVWALYRANIQTGAAVQVERGNSYTVGWTSFGGHPVVRYDTNARGTIISASTRAPGAATWTPYRKIRVGDHGKWDFNFVAATDDPNVVLVASSDGQEDGGDAIQSFDLRTNQLTGVVRKARHGVEYVVTDLNRRLFAAGFLDDRVGYDFVDPTLKAPYRALEAYFEKTCNVAISGLDSSGKRLLLSVSGPREPQSWFLYDRTAKTVDPLGAARDWLTPERLAPMEVLSVTAGDGQALRAYLTAPIVGSGKRPLVVMPHGGPEVRDHFDYDTWAQALAARGWFVLQPNFRGSSGYGRAFTEAGWKQWGGLAQQDVEDCLAHVIATGRVDPQRVAIMGASYGGYSALMGAVRRPDLYKAAVSIAGDCDLMQMLAAERAEGPDSPSYRYWARVAGDPDTDRAMLEAASPRLHVARITAPVLLIHGKDDTVVLPEQSRFMRDAMKKAGKSVEWLEIEKMGHRDWTPTQSTTVLTKAIDFLATRLGG